ncbi:hypothetical protein [Anoxybacillus flavithermus]|uniref:hypothetical protein n=1 Tax=Anoxybacillus flavithermus TaxID=33934 RepID=UPI001F5052A7|nr:hypothetical protein [Anoxybacillus flavithermus]
MSRWLWLSFIFLFIPQVVWASEKEEWIVQVRHTSDVRHLQPYVVDTIGTFVKVAVTEEERENISRLPFVLNMEKNDIKRAAVDDPLFSEQWSLAVIDWHIPSLTSMNRLIGKQMIVDGREYVYDGESFEGEHIVIALGEETLSRLSVTVDHIEGSWRIQVKDETGAMLGENEGELARLDVLLSRPSSTVHLYVMAPNWTNRPRIVELKGVNHVIVAIVDSGVVQHEDLNDHVLYSVSVDYAEKNVMRMIRLGMGHM